MTSEKIKIINRFNDKLDDKKYLLIFLPILCMHFLRKSPVCGKVKFPFFSTCNYMPLNSGHIVGVIAHAFLDGEVYWKNDISWRYSITTPFI